MKVLFDRNSSIFFKCTTRKGKKIVYRYQGPRSGITGVTFLNASSKIRNPYENSATVVKQIAKGGILHKVRLADTGYWKYCEQCNLNGNDQTSNQCIQKRRALRNYQNSQKEIKSVNRNQSKIAKIRKTYFDNSSFPRKLYKHIKTNGHGDNIYKKYCYINGCWNCKGKITIPYGTSIWKYTCNKLNPVTRCEVDHFDGSDPVCFKYEFINGLWQYKCSSEDPKCDCSNGKCFCGCK